MSCLRAALSWGCVLGVCLPDLAGCDSEKKAPQMAPKARSQAIQGDPSQAPPARPTAAPKPTAAAPHQPRQLCQTRQDASAPVLATDGLEVRAAPGAPLPPQKLAVGGGSWTWVNFWAAWCAPCKAEIPLLRSWERRLRESGVEMTLQFISLDDDERQLAQFLKNPGKTELSSTYWLREGTDREQWLERATVDKDPELPVQLIVDASGRIRCVIQGAVEASDWPEVAKLFGAQ